MTSSTGVQTTEGQSGSTGSVPTECEPVYDDPIVLRGEDAPGLSGVASLVASGTRVYACTRDAGVVLWSVEDPTAPALVARDLWPDGAGPARCEDLALGEDGLAAVRRADADGNGGVLATFTLDADGIPTPANAAFDDWSVHGVAALDGGRWAVAAGTQGVLLVDATATMTGVAVDEDSDARRVVADGDRVIAAEGQSGVRIYDAAGDEPLLLGATGLAGASVDLVVADDVAYVLTLDNLAMVDVTSDTPELIAQAPTPGNALEVAVVGGKAYVADWEAITAVDVADPAAPLTTAREALTGAAALPRTRTATACGDNLCVGEWNGLQVFAVGDNAAPDLHHEPAQVRFDDAPVGDSEEQVLVVRNYGAAPLRICGIDHDFGDLSIEPATAEIDAGGALPFTLTWTAAAADPVAGTLILYSDDPDRPTVEVPIVGNDPGVRVGDPVPAFFHVDTTGRAWSDADLQGKVALLSYFASWCSACNQHFPDFDDVLWASHRDDDFLAFGLGNESTAKILTFGVNTGTTFPLLLSETTYQIYDDPPGEDYSLQVVVDKTGTIRRMGHEELDAQALDPFIVELLAE